MITVNLTVALAISATYAAGFYLLLQRSLMRVLLGVVILGHASNLLLQVSGGAPSGPPLVGEGPSEAMTDPLPQALALTAIVITFALTTFLLALSYRSYRLIGHDEVQDDVEDRRIARRRMPAAPLEGPGSDRETGGRAAEEADDRVEAAARGEGEP